MLSYPSFLSRAVRMLGAFYLDAHPQLSMFYAQIATAPTASEEPANIDQLWQKASSKYDAQRAALLKEVDDVRLPRPIPAGLGVTAEI